MTTSLDDQPLDTILAAAAARSGPLGLGPPLWGFGGVQGGLSLALLTEAMRGQAHGRALRHVTARYRRPLRAEVEIDVADDGAGKSVAWLTAKASAHGAVGVEASAAFAVVGKPNLAAHFPRMPEVPGPRDCDVFTIPLDFVPFARRTQVRFVGDARPYARGGEPALTAWIRLVEDDRPPTDARLLILLDSLPPSFAAVLAALTPIPTVTFSVTPSDRLGLATSPWVLVRARTDTASPDGWLLERTDAWSEDGTYLGTAEQLRVVMGR